MFGLNRLSSALVGHGANSGTLSFVMPGLVPGIHAFLCSLNPKKAWMAGT
jgi:hypothetical protein